MSGRIRSLGLLFLLVSWFGEKQVINVHFFEGKNGRGSKRHTCLLFPLMKPACPIFGSPVFGAHATTMPENGRRTENGQAPKNPYGIRGRGRGGDTGRTCEHRVAKRVNRNSPLRVSACLECLHLYRTLEEGGGEEPYACIVWILSLVEEAWQHPPPGSPYVFSRRGRKERRFFACTSMGWRERGRKEG